MTIDRDWTAARVKIAEEGGACRLAAWQHRYGPCHGPVAAAHVIGRKHDQVVIGPRGGERVFVDADDVVPLCTRHHERYDRRAIDLLPHLTLTEQSAACRHVGISRALARITGGGVA